MTDNFTEILGKEFLCHPIKSRFPALEQSGINYDRLVKLNAGMQICEQIELIIRMKGSEPESSLSGVYKNVQKVFLNKFSDPDEMQTLLIGLNDEDLIKKSLIMLFVCTSLKITKVFIFGCVQKEEISRHSSLSNVLREICEEKIAVVHQWK